jgi:hypothetical protein
MIKPSGDKVTVPGSPKERDKNPLNRFKPWVSRNVVVKFLKALDVPNEKIAKAINRDVKTVERDTKEPLPDDLRYTLGCSSDDDDEVVFRLILNICLSKKIPKNDP